MDKSSVSIRKRFRFQDLDIWERAMDIADALLNVADSFADQHLFRFAEQIRGAALSISNNIAEGSGADSKKEFARYLGIAKKSAFENANMVILFNRRGLLDTTQSEWFLDQLEQESRMIEAFRKSLRN